MDFPDTIDSPVKEEEKNNDTCSIIATSSQIVQVNESLLRLGRINPLLDLINDAPSYETVINNPVDVTDLIFKSEPKINDNNLKPPSYDAVMKTSVPSDSQLPRYQEVSLSDAPPSYRSIFTESVFLRAINAFNDDEDSNVVTNISRQNRHGIHHIWFNIFVVLLIVFVFVLPLTMIIVGIFYIHDCPAQPRIPIYLIVLGFFQMLECCGRICYSVFKSHQHQPDSWRERYRRKDPLVYFVIVWFVIGSMWIYQTNPDCRNCDAVSNKIVYNDTVNFINSTAVPMPHLTANKKIYCNEIVYGFAFWVITSYYGVIGFFCLLILIDVLARAISRCFCSS